ncbi:Molybdopterin molybdenumtransferase [Halomonadaceae bacterium LMG 33818]|uniref:molybdopterin molybdotransferase MoeA n=1 Tax=Cernens ardua TaxID=3402176 RepID=UPI003EDC1235
MMVTRLSVEEAQTVWLRWLASRIKPFSASCVPLSGAVGKRLAEDLCSPGDLPPRSVSAMDGYAFDSRSVVSSSPPLQLACIGHSMAGEPFKGTVEIGECVQIATGADIPAGCDTVVVIERCRVEGDGQSAAVFPYITDSKQTNENARHPPFPSRNEVVGANIRQQGEVIKTGDLLLKAGQRLDFRHVALLAALGVEAVCVKRLPRVAVFSTGDELQEEAKSTLHDSNRPMLIALLTAYGAEVHDGGTLPDDQKAIAQALSKVCGDVDLIMTSGGVSMGPRDHLRHVLEEQHGVALWKMAVRPGKSVLCGEWKGTPLLGLPGNPLAAFAMYSLLGIPALESLQGATQRYGSVRATLTEHVKGQRGRVDLLLGVHKWNNEGNLKGGFEVSPLPSQQSHRIDMLSCATCFILLDTEQAVVDAHQWVRIVMFDDLLGYSLMGTTALYQQE